MNKLKDFIIPITIITIFIAVVWINSLISSFTYYNVTNLRTGKVYKASEVHRMSNFSWNNDIRILTDNGEEVVLSPPYSIDKVLTLPKTPQGQEYE